MFIFIFFLVSYFNMWDFPLILLNLPTNFFFKQQFLKNEMVHQVDLWNTPKYYFSYNFALEVWIHRIYLES